jgi:hypothetical protein
LNALGFFFSSTELTFPSFSFCRQTNQRAHDNESFMKNTCPNHHHEEEAVEGNQAMPEEDNASADKDETMCGSKKFNKESGGLQWSLEKGLKLCWVN